MSMVNYTSVNRTGKQTIRLGIAHLSIRVYIARMDKDICTLLREIKAATNWSETRIASELHTSQPTVNRILNGQAECKGSTLRAITDLHARHASSSGV
jgi:AraC-like DNA-binding protein